MPAEQQKDPKSRILATAATVFAEKGYLGGSLNEIASRSQLTRAGLLHHFPSKERLLLGLLDRRDQELSEQFGDLFQPVSGETLADLLALLHTAVERIVADRNLVKLAHALTAEASEPNHPAHDWAAARHRRLRLRIASAVDESRRRGELAPGLDAEAFAAVLLGTIEGVEAQWLITPDEVDPTRAADVLVFLLRAALL